MTSQLFRINFSSGLPGSEYFANKVRERYEMRQNESSLWYFGTEEGANEFLLDVCGISTINECTCGCRERYIYIMHNWNPDSADDFGTVDSFYDDCCINDIVIVGD